jgi:hypothetical protein
MSGSSPNPSEAEEGRSPQFEAIHSHGYRGDEGEGGDAVRRHNSMSIMEEDDRRELQRLATAITLQRHHSAAGLEGVERQATLPPSDPVLDPSSKSFDLSKWLRYFIRELQKEGFTLKSAGVAYQDLTVSGTGDAVQLQSTVYSMLTAPLRAGDIFSFKKKGYKPILHRFDGILNGGELLIVLGRPGSGCSTLLKTITGQLHGLHVDEKTTIHYNGIPQKEMINEFKGETTYNQEVRVSRAESLMTVQADWNSF